MQRPRMNRPIQRKRLTCAECTRRKIKCDKVLPCSNCTRRGIVCYRHAEQRPRRPSTATVTSTSNSPDAEPGCRSDATELVNHLTARVRDLESTLRKIQSVQDTASSSSSTRSSHAPATSTDSNTHFERQLSPTEQNDLASPTQDLGNAEVENAATILEFLAWGRRKDPDYNEVITQKEDGSVPNQSPGDVGTGGGGLEEWPSDESWSLSGSKTSFIPFLRFLLPSRHQLVQIVDYHRHCLLWYHASFHSLALKAELEDFLDCYNGCVENPDVDLQWVAFLFSVMAGSMACAPRPVAQSWGFQKSEQRSLANRWFEATVVCLGLADYTACHSIYSVQAISTLTIAAHILGHSNRQSVLLASAVRVAQSLGLHRLGQEVDGPLSLNLVKREIGRRVWSQLCVQDWFSIPFSETYLIHGPSFNSRKPRNCHEEDMHPLPDDIPTDMAFNRFLYDVAALMPQLQDGLASCNTLYTKYEQVLRYDARMRELATSHIPCYLQNVPLDASWPCHVMWARKSVTISLSHKIIMIHRKFLGLSFTNPAFRFTRKTCVAASKTILKEQKKAANDNGPVLWIYDAFSVAACIILCFDMSHRNPSDKEYNEHLEIVQDVIEILSHSDISMIARRGVAILNALLDRENTKLDISEFIKSFCQQERSGPGQTRQGLGKNKQPGWPPGNADFIHSLQGPEAASNNPSMAPSTTDPSLADGRPESQTTSDPTSRSHYGCRQSGDELFFDFMPSQLGEFSTASHSWEDILFLAQNSAV